MEPPKTILDGNTGAAYISITGDAFTLLPYNKVDKIGLGSTGDVFLLEGTEKPDVKVVAKALYFDRDNKDKLAKSWKRFLHETAILQHVRHENIVKHLGSVACPTYALVLLEFYPEGPLYEHLRTLEDTHVHRYFVQISCALRHMHSKRIVHRDVKLDNILVRKNVAYLADFGLSCRLEKDSAMVKGRLGTPVFMAPEVDVEHPDPEYDGIKADSYAAGVFLWCMLMRKEPDDEQDLLLTLNTKKHNPATKERLHPVLHSCAKRLLQPDPKLRWDVTMLLKHLHRIGYRKWQIDILWN